ncbi:hypothetical protein K438DRAFT_1760844 [Mycena galopus ATCC 62051]|nr:hypothetical protein K438DRAFT_1760844 [Mycena galopus ATCC 62051]
MPASGLPSRSVHRSRQSLPESTGRTTLLVETRSVPCPLVVLALLADFSSQYPSGVLEHEIGHFEILPVDNSLVLPTDFVLSKPRASIVPPSAPPATLAPSSSTSRPSKKDKKKAKEGKLRDLECKLLSSDDSDSSEMMPLSEFPAESAVRRQKPATSARPQPLPTPRIMTTKLNTGGQSRMRPADNTVPVESLPKKKSCQAVPKTPVIIEDSDDDIVEEVPAPKLKGKDKKNTLVHPTTSGKKLPPAAAKKGTVSCFERFDPIKRT